MTSPVYTEAHVRAGAQALVAAGQQCGNRFIQAEAGPLARKVLEAAAKVEVGEPLRELAEANRDRDLCPTIPVDDIHPGDVVRMVAKGGRLTGPRTILAVDDQAVAESSLPPLSSPASLGRRCLFWSDENGDSEVGWKLRVDHVVLVDRPTVDAAEFREAVAMCLDAVSDDDPAKALRP